MISLTNNSSGNVVGKPAAHVSERRTPKHHSICDIVDTYTSTLKRYLPFILCRVLFLSIRNTTFELDAI